METNKLHQQALTMTDVCLCGYAKIKESGRIVPVRSLYEMIPKNCKVLVYDIDFSGIFLIQRIKI